MKKRLLIGLAVVLTVGLVIWYHTPIHVADADPADVGEDTSIYLKNGERAGGWNDFIINSADSVRAGAFYYRVADGVIEYDYLKQLVNKA